MPNVCPFCHPDKAQIIVENEFGFAIPDGFPVTEGHALVLPRKHVASLFDLPHEEQAGLWRLVALARSVLLEKFQPEAFNIGVNDGQAAGQTVMHAHIHVIPRYVGDSADPRGGIRWVLPSRARYWEDG